MNCERIFLQGCLGCPEILECREVSEFLKKMSEATRNQLIDSMPSDNLQQTNLCFLEDVEQPCRRHLD